MTTPADTSHPCEELGCGNIVSADDVPYCHEHIRAARVIEYSYRQRTLPQVDKSPDDILDKIEERLIEIEQRLDLLEQSMKSPGKNV